MPLGFPVPRLQRPLCPPEFTPFLRVILRTGSPDHQDHPIICAGGTPPGHPESKGLSSRHPGVNPVFVPKPRATKSHFQIFKDLTSKLLCWLNLTRVPGFKKRINYEEGQSRPEKCPVPSGQSRTLDTQK